MERAKRAQASVELMVVLGVILMVFTVMSLIIYKNYTRTEDLKIHVFGTRLANRMASTIDDLNAVGDGYTTYLVIPEMLYGGRNYTVNFYSDEAQVYLEGGVFSTGSDLRFSAPISTSHVNCLMGECYGRCNKSTDEQCLEVKNRTSIRLTKLVGGIYLAPEYNIKQGGNELFVAPFTGRGGVQAANQDRGIVTRAGNEWNVVYIWQDLTSDNVSLVFSLNNTNNPEVMYIDELMGQLLGFSSDDAGEFNPATPPAAQWANGAPSGGELDGGVLTFKGGFRACLTPGASMPTQQWIFLSSDGGNIALAKSQTVCVNYP